MSQLESRHGILINGGFYQGAYGPSIILILQSVEAAAWLDGILLRLGETGAPWSLSAQALVHLVDVEDL